MSLPLTIRTGLFLDSTKKSKSTKEGVKRFHHGERKRKRSTSPLFDSEPDSELSMDDAPLHTKKKRLSTVTSDSDDENEVVLKEEKKKEKYLKRSLEKV